MIADKPIEPVHYRHRFYCDCYACKEEREERREKPSEREERACAD